MTQPTENIVTLFKNSNGNCNVVLHGTNQVVSFIEGKFFTTDKKLERLLQEHADEGEMGIFVDKSESSIDTEAATPMAQLEKKLRAKILQEMRENGLNQSSSYAPDPRQAQAAIGGTDTIVGADTLNPVILENKEASTVLKEEEVKQAEPPANLSALERLEWLKNNKPS